jgi:transglutaminase-like putative cysteine protease
MLDIEVAHRELVLHARSTIETFPRTAFDPAATTAWDRLDDAMMMPAGSDLDLDVIQYRCPSRLTVASLDIADYAAASFPQGTPVMAGALDLVDRVYADFTFDATATDVSTPITTVFKKRRGVCQDFAHLSLACLRAKRIPARYVSGFILTRPPPGQTKLQGTDATHAWISVWAPQTGWVDFDPTNKMLAGQEHVAIAYGRDYDDVSPISGVLLGGGEHTVTVAVDVVQV